MTKEIEIANYLTRVLNPVNENTKIIEKKTEKKGMSTGAKAAVGGGVGATAITAGVILL